jgi:hypothetical protein
MEIVLVILILYQLQSLPGFHTQPLSCCCPHGHMEGQELPPGSLCQHTPGGTAIPLPSTLTGHF